MSCDGSVLSIYSSNYSFHQTCHIDIDSNLNIKIVDFHVDYRSELLTILTSDSHILLYTCMLRNTADRTSEYDFQIQSPFLSRPSKFHNTKTGGFITLELGKFQLPEQSQKLIIVQSLADNNDSKIRCITTSRKQCWEFVFDQVSRTLRISTDNVLY